MRGTILREGYSAIGAGIATLAYVGRQLYVGEDVTLKGAATSAAVGFAFGSGAVLLPGATAVVGAGLTGYSAGNVAQRAANYSNLSPKEKRAVKADTALTVLAVVGLGGAAKGAGKAELPDAVFGAKAPDQVTPGTSALKGQYMNDQGRIEPWEAHYDEYGRQIERTDSNAGNKAQGIPDTHHHTREFGPDSYHHGPTREDHIPGPGPRSE